jgi:hypothetical protein
MTLRSVWCLSASLIVNLRSLVHTIKGTKTPSTIGMVSAAYIKIAGWCRNTMT